MGMFDSIILNAKCPYCHTVHNIEFQTKDLDCMLEVWRKGDFVGSLQYTYLTTIADCRSKECLDWRDSKEGYSSGFGRFFWAKVFLKEGKVTGEFEITEIDNSEQEDKRSVATKSNQGDDDGNINGIGRQPNNKSMKWIKASERLPEAKGHFIIRRPTLNKGEWIKHEAIFNPEYEDIKERWLSFEYEWLDESPLPSNEDELAGQITIIIFDECNNWRNNNERETIPTKAFLRIAKSAANKIVRITRK